MEPQPQSPASLYFEDLQVGQRFTSGTYQVTEAAIKTFAAEFDPQPFHLDDAAARATIFGGLAASGWHTAAVTMRLLVTSNLHLLAGGVIGLGGEVSWPTPVRPGDTLSVQSEILEIRSSRSKPDRGIVKVRSTTFNQNGEEVQILLANLMVFRRTLA